MSAGFDVSCLGLIAELSSTFIVKEQDTIARSDCDVRFGVVIVVAHSTAGCIGDILQP